jgi:DNA-binding MarR family transcriptional regulator/GNAT superfamily N-acetyltransferase
MDAAESPESLAQVAAVRRFGRFYTAHVGALAEGLLDSPYPLAEARVLYELAQGTTTASVLGARLRMDPAQLSRILRRLENAGLVYRATDAADARRQVLHLSQQGATTVAGLDRASQAQVAGWLAPLPDAARRRLVTSLGTVERLLGGATPRPALRPLRPGDLGWVVGAHGRIYDAEYGWDRSFEALVAGIVRDVSTNFDPARECAWIAELNGAPVGSAFLVRGPDAATAKLRLVIVEPAARGLGLGRNLVRTCEDFARAQGYRRITLWTHSVLLAARALYASEGYRLVASAPHHSFGHDLVEETWDKDLTAPRTA